MIHADVVFVSRNAWKELPVEADANFGGVHLLEQAIVVAFAAAEAGAVQAERDPRSEDQIKGAEVGTGAG